MFCSVCKEAADEDPEEALDAEIIGYTDDDEERDSGGDDDSDFKEDFVDRLIQKNPAFANDSYNKGK